MNASDTATPASILAPLAGQTTAQLTTYRKDGTLVATPVSLVVDGDRVVFRTWSTAGKAKRIRHNPAVTIAPATAVQGKPTGQPIHARARVLEGDEAREARRLLGQKYPFFQRYLVPWYHRLTGKETIHLEAIPDE